MELLDKLDFSIYIPSKQWNIFFFEMNLFKSRQVFTCIN